MLLVVNLPNHSKRKVLSVSASESFKLLLFLFPVIFHVGFLKESHINNLFNYHYITFPDGSLKNRLLDYKKASQAFNFKNTLRPNSSIREEHSIFNANVVFWFGDLNFRLAERLNTDDISEKYGKKIFVHRQDFDELLTVDELKQSMEDGLVFNGFREANIIFPPSYKFITGTQTYSKRRIPSYTVSYKVLYK